ncbi:MAG: hypothetical protein RTU30_14155 [Candidatus Thorarchaeota archaeon]
MKTEKTREDRFDDVYQIVLIVVALSFDILWFFGRIPIAEIAVFIFILVIWAYGHLKGGETEYAYKLGSFNLSVLLLTNFYTVALTGNQDLPLLLQIVAAIIVFPAICLIISMVLYSYLKESVHQETAIGILVGGTLGYTISMLTVALLG